MWKTIFSATAVVLGMALTPALGGTLTPIPATYTAFDGTDYSVSAWDGNNIALLTQESGYDPAVMTQIVAALDGAWKVYHDMTNKVPLPWPATTRNGRSTIVDVPDGRTCGAGCAYLGYNGIEIMNTYWQILYDGVRERAEYDQVLFYEQGRNFWFYGAQLSELPGATTGFAIANRFVTMEQVGLDGGPFGSYDFEIFERLATDDLVAAYLADPLLDWRNTLAIDAGVPGQVFAGGADLAGALMHRIYSDHGPVKYGAFWQNLDNLPGAQSSELAMQNWIDAAYGATGQDYRPILKATDLPLVPLSGTVLFLGTGLMLLAGVGRKRFAQ